MGRSVLLRGGEGRRTDGSQGARIQPVRAVARRPGARAEGWQVSPAAARSRPRGARESQVRRTNVLRNAIIMATSIAALFATAVLAQEGKESTEGLAMQTARAKMMSARGAKIAY